MPVGKRREAFEKWFEEQEEDFEDRVIPLDLDVMKTWGSYCASQKSKGNDVAVMDSLIGSSALHYGMTVVTRNDSDFPDIPLINPWK